MQTLIIGRFGQYDQAQATAARLHAAGFHADNMSLFYLSPPGHHGSHPLGGDEDESHGTHQASSGAVKGVIGGAGAGTLIGAMTLPVLGPAGPLLGAAVGAYAGSFVGAIGSMEKSAEAREEAADRHTDPAVIETAATVGQSEPDASSSVILAVAVPTPGQHADALKILSEFAEHIEHAEGEIRSGLWIDVDPASLHRTVGIKTAGVKPTGSTDVAT
jgi:hypothetical protein